MKIPFMREPRATSARRRSHQPNKYYPVQLAFSYQALRRGDVIQRGSGETIEISSTSVRVKPLMALAQATTDVVMWIAWPAKLDDGTSLHCVILAKPQWDGSGLVELEIMKYQFRTAASRALGNGSF
jgi:hypothetical protein